MVQNEVKVDEPMPSAASSTANQPKSASACPPKQQQEPHRKQSNRQQVDQPVGQPADQPVGQPVGPPLGKPLVHPLEQLRQVERERQQPMDGVSFAKCMDQLDELGAQRARFQLPLKKDIPGFAGDAAAGAEDCIYLCGQSLGLCPRSARTNVQRVMDNWATLGVFTHTEGYLPAAFCDLPAKASMARLVGAEPDEVAILNGLTVNLHLLLATFYRPTAQRYKILIEEHAFPSDLAQLHGLDPDECIVLMKPKQGELTLRESEMEQLIDRHRDSAALVLLPGLQYYTGQWVDVPRLTCYAQARGLLVGVDLAHSVGNIRLQLTAWNVDFACWCTYKYLCSGPGGFGGIFVSKRFTQPTAASAADWPVPMLKGWWGNRLDTKFNMSDKFDPMPGADVFKLSNPPPLLAATLMASLEIFDEVTMERVQRKQRLITGYLEYLLCLHFAGGADGRPAGRQSVKIITPPEPERRGSQLSLMFSLPLDNVQKQLERRGVVCDIRLPNVMRVTPVALYCSYLDVFRFVQHLREIFEQPADGQLTS